MPANDDDPFARLLRKFARLVQIDADDRAAIEAMPFAVEPARSGDYLVREGDIAQHCDILLAGYACRHKVTVEGRRQIVSFHLPGDILDLEHLSFARADHSVQLITDATVARISSDVLKQVAASRPNIAEALWRDSLIDGAIFREWILNVGRRDPKARIAHMLCEFAARREAAGLGAPETLHLPMNVDEIADATGLTAVHVNRSLASMEADGTIGRAGKLLEIRDWGRLQQVAGFDPLYLRAAA